MSGPLAKEDSTLVAADVAIDAGDAGLDVLEGRSTEVGGIPVSRVLPRRARRTVGAWCFVDHFGPTDVDVVAMEIGPHPHMGLHTVTWVLDGEVVHRDSLGSEQLIRPGQLNLMTAGAGVAHAEETPRTARGRLHGVQLWVAQPEGTRFGPAAFEHHPELPGVEAGAGVEVTVLVGELAGGTSPARADTPMVGADLVVDGAATLPLDSTYEHAVVVVDGTLEVDGRSLGPGVLGYLPPGRDELTVTGRRPARALLLGGVPFEPVLMWWNFVARTWDELDDARRDWDAGAERFGEVSSPLGRIPAPPPRDR